ncbi:MAG: hypothetical protein QM784_28105 [Polyangiaceae bacterium]
MLTIAFCRNRRDDLTPTDWLRPLQLKRQALCRAAFDFVMVELLLRTAACIAESVAAPSARPMPRGLLMVCIVKRCTGLDSSIHLVALRASL